MVTSDLITEQAAAISRGISILSDTGDIGNIGISMPLHQDIGVLKPSTLIEVNDGEQWVGMVRGTTITGRLSSNRALEIDQSIDVERHFDKGWIMDFTEALSLVEKGEWVGRQVWGKGYYLFMDNDDGKFNISPTGRKVLTCRAAGVDYFYLLRGTDAQAQDLQDDLFARDWVSFGVNKEG